LQASTGLDDSLSQRRSCGWLGRISFPPVLTPLRLGIPKRTLAIAGGIKKEQQLKPVQAAAAVRTMRFGLKSRSARP